MSIKSHISDPSTGIKAEVIDNGLTKALSVLTQPFTSYTGTTKPFTNDIYGIDMNQNAVSGGTPVKIHDGIDSALWTASAISGTWTFNSAAQNHTAAGALSINATATGKNDVAQIAKGSSQVLTGYTSFSGWIYLTAWGSGTQHVSLRGWDTGTGAIVGNLVNIDSYINTGILNVWQRFIIPFSDMGLVGQTIDSIRIRTESSAVAPDYYLDDIQIEETGTPIKFSVIPQQGQTLYIEKFIVIMADAMAGTLASATMPNLAYNKFLALSALTNGFAFQQQRKSQIVFSSTYKQLSDILMFPTAKIENVGSDGTNTWMHIVIDLIEPIVIQDSLKDILSLIVNDDMSGLLLFRATAVAKVEQ